MGLKGPSMDGWWQCCQCLQQVNSLWYVTSCTDCNHRTCQHCTNLGSAALPAEEDVDLDYDGLSEVASERDRANKSAAKSRSLSEDAVLGLIPGQVVASEHVCQPSHEHEVLPSCHDEDQFSSKSQADTKSASLTTATLDGSNSSKTSSLKITAESQELVRLILNDPVVKQLCFEAITERPNARIMVDCRRLIDEFSLDLQKESVESDAEKTSQVVAHLAPCSAYHLQSKVSAEGIWSSGATFPDLGDSNGQALDDKLTESRNLILGSQALRLLRDKIKIELSKPFDSVVISSAQNNHDEDTEEDIKVSTVPSEHVSTYRSVALFSSLAAWTRSYLLNSVPSGMKRVRWTCACGASLYDDYEELVPGAAANMEQYLRATSPRSCEPQDFDSNDRPDVPPQSHSFITRLCSDAVRFFSRKPQPLPQGELPSFELRSAATGQTTTSNEPSLQALFLLVCMNDGIGDSILRLQQLSLYDIDSDRKLFQTLGKMYTTLRHRWWSSLSLWSLQSINFVNFDVYDKFLVDIKDQHVVPPVDEHSYLYQPSGLKPPIGSHLLMHYMRCPQDATMLTPCLAKVPKKIDRKLQVCPIKGVSPGWGLQFIEGWHWKKIFLGSFIVFLASAITVAIICRYSGRSVQDAMAISSFMLACFALSVGALQAWLNMV